jgi:hypothetical protein
MYSKSPLFTQGVKAKVQLKSSIPIGAKVEMFQGLLALPTKARIFIVFRFILECSSLRDFGPPR